MVKDIIECVNIRDVARLRTRNISIIQVLLNVHYAMQLQSMNMNIADHIIMIKMGILESVYIVIMY